MNIKDEINGLLDSLRNPETTEADIDLVQDRIIEIIDVIEQRVHEILDEAIQVGDSLERLFHEL